MKITGRLKKRETGFGRIQAVLSDGLRLTEKLKIQKYAYDYRAVGEVEVQQKYRQPAHRTVIAVGAGKLRRSGGMVF